MSALAGRLAQLRRQAGVGVAGGNREPRDAALAGGEGVRSRLAPRMDAPVPREAGCREWPPLLQEAERGACVEAAVAAHAAGASLTIETLRRLLGIRERRPVSPPYAFDRELPGREIAPGVRLHEHRLPSPPMPAQLDLRELGIAEAAPARMLCFDTETTGLAGGTGTRAFMLGAGDWHDGGFRVRQLTLTTLGGEAAMLEVFASWLGAGTLLVSYNGRSYDAPLLNTRYRLARLASPLSGLAHLDLLYPVRRRYRGVWANCRLATIERELLGVVRDDDLPGSEAPRAWRTWLQGGSAGDLRRVGAHNRQDLASLAQLLVRLTEAAPDP